MPLVLSQVPYGSAGQQCSQGLTALPGPWPVVTKGEGLVSRNLIDFYFQASV